VSEDANTSTEPAREAKPAPIFISKLNDPSLLRQLLNKVANDECELKNINTGNFKIKIKSSIEYTNIVKKIRTRNFEFHTYKSKQEGSFKVVLKHMPPEERIDEIRRDIEELGHKVTNIWNIRKRGTKVTLNMFYVELKPQKSNKDIYKTTHVLDYTIKFEPPHPKREIRQCINCY